ncbi:phenylalanine--tRNA ligase subunit beta [Curtobacterium sp. MCBD17_034]|uniref:phenylalanine--tRNA ligase subunit beta n=1 Tax=unclassified Curtobacterium TaxID=257496 RepID=UPI000DA71D5C|nr:MULTISPECIES: phenylalanine--tRNA ligase subunit beta [unclassified Curtobacterium]PZF56556.1 phenylalanine--tRNA ligase subunit beta [Curtobacterium sp. MCBD17_034]PZM33740.1 phenylalanine--tRNA ligase subunit beta [Curtobacterium sp. MCBD17_031]
MRVPLRWLGESVDLPEDATLEHVHAALVSVGFEEEAEHAFDLTGPIVVGRVLERVPEPQKNGKTINWCQVDVGEPEPRGIVCGAHNFDVGDLVVVTLPGAVLPGPFPIAARKTYGHVSDGMIASARELGLGEDHDGILRFADLGMEPEVGADAIALLGLDDAAVEINVTPDRGYAFSIRGVAREYAHATGATFHDPAERPAPRSGDGFAVTIADDAPIRGTVGARTFVTRVVRGIDPTRPTPAWMIARLRLVGVRSISLPVDITNYVMFELGQPLHGYDLGALQGGLTVRRATPGETLVTLDDVERRLDPEDLVIADDAGPVGLAGVMGGARTEIGTGTTDVLIEAAGFDPVSIARSARRHKLPSEASKRFERGVDPLVAEAAAARAVELLVELAGGTADDLGSTVVDRSPRPAVSMRLDAPQSVVGVAYTEAEVVETLRSVGAEVTTDADLLTVTPPSWRPDLVDGVSLIEEVARIVGYARIPSVLPVAPPGRGLSRAQRARRRVVAALAAQGLVEVVTAPFVSTATADAFPGIDAAGGPSVALANPLDSELHLLRRSGLPGLVDIARRNTARGLVDVAVFEAASVFLPAVGAELGTTTIPRGAERPDDATLAAMTASLPAQPTHVSALLTGSRLLKQPGVAAEPYGVADALDVARTVAWAVGAELTVAQTEHPSMHPGRAALVSVGDHPVGVVGELLPSTTADADLPRVVAVVELDLDALVAAAPAAVLPEAIVSYPAATQDLSLVVDVGVPAGAVLDAVRDGAGPLLEYARLVDDYRGAGVTEGQKSLTFALRFRATDRTLTAAEATEARDGAVRRAGERFGATLRD